MCSRFLEVPRYLGLWNMIPTGLLNDCFLLSGISGQCIDNDYKNESSK